MPTLIIATKNYMHSSAMPIGGLADIDREDALPIFVADPLMEAHRSSNEIKLLICELNVQ